VSANTRKFHGAVIAIVNSKGGVGKTTLVREVGAACALRGYKVLIVDGDKNCTLTLSLFKDLGSIKKTLFHVMVGESSNGAQGDRVYTDISEIIIPTDVPGLFIAPGGGNIDAFEEQRNVEDLLRLRENINRIRRQFDLIMIDAPGNYGKTLDAAMMASQWVLIPTTVHEYAVSQFDRLSKTINSISKLTNGSTKRLGTVICLFDPRLAVETASRKAMESKAYLIGPIFKSDMQALAAFKEAPIVKQPVLTYMKSSKAAEKVTALTDEFLEKLGMPASVTASTS
jgi:chromosome partitioning protein